MTETPTRRPRPVKLVRHRITEEEIAAGLQAAHELNERIGWQDPPTWEQVQAERLDVTAEPEPHALSAYIAARFRSLGH